MFVFDYIIYLFYCFMVVPFHHTLIVSLLIIHYFYYYLYKNIVIIIIYQVPDCQMQLLLRLNT